MSKLSIKKHPTITKYLSNEKKELCVAEKVILKNEPKKQQAVLLKAQGYFLGENYPEVCLELNEARCLAYLIRGFDEAYMARAMNFSVRTVDFYCNNLRRKIPSDSLNELVELVKSTDFVDYIDHLIG